MILNARSSAPVQDTSIISRLSSLITLLSTDSTESSINTHQNNHALNRAIRSAPPLRSHPLNTNAQYTEHLKTQTSVTCKLYLWPRRISFAIFASLSRISSSSFSIFDSSAAMYSACSSHSLIFSTSSFLSFFACSISMFSI